VVECIIRNSCQASKLENRLISANYALAYRSLFATIDLILSLISVFLHLSLSLSFALYGSFNSYIYTRIYELYCRNYHRELNCQSSRFVPSIYPINLLSFVQVISVSSLILDVLPLFCLKKNSIVVLNLQSCQKSYISICTFYLSTNDTFN
jgi:hypothetical protein